MEIIIIGTEPPCPRCRETYERVKKVAEGIEPKPLIRKIVYSSEEAQRFGKVGSGHEVAEWAGFEIDWEEVHKLASGEWNQALDAFLMPLAEEAMKKGWIMTPVVVIDGTVVHFGHVPEMDKIRSWLSVKT
ncbi:MAG: hypothetical protein H6Q46_439 [Deltaproteobacteria bacterium]|jgi:hypothetical protein|nr:hypothetical protein [Deltaproteobacteria bacterium]